ncbi:NRDE family protein [Actinomadura alba]|uniref:NRDE family protein n=1 Tax=Actinomadura alba TaxID=406431 RepID=A0ABR7LS54_9ACTN|nr:NRDE family protein [Actinomadura alba]MBC6467616.1 NRDE family protein [Actinomadura alba]
MCTALISFVPSAPVPVLLAGIRDEVVDRLWEPPGPHWPDRPGVIGGRDLRAGGTWLAVDPRTSRVACVLNGHGRPAPEGVRVSRGVLPLNAAADGKPGDIDPERLDPFHLLCAEPTEVRLWSWNGDELTERSLAPGLHLIVNSGLKGGDDLADLGPGGEHMSARLAHFRPRLAAVPRPVAGDGPTAEAWGEWLPLIDGDGLDRADPRALVVRREIGDGRVYGTTSTSLVALSGEGLRFDFSAEPGRRDAWYRVR